LRVLVSGGGGFIGCHLIDSLAGDGVEVGVVDTGEMAGKWQSHDVAFFQASICDRAALRRVFDAVRPDLVYHLAAMHYIPDCDARPASTWETNVDGTREVAGQAHRCGAALVFASSAAVYAPTEVPHREEDALAPIDVYGRSKLAAERVVREFSKRGNRVVIARLFNTYGPGETTPHLIPRVVSQIAAGAEELVLGSLDPARDYIHVLDVVSALRLLGDPSVAGSTFNVGTGVQTSVREVVELCAQTIGRPLSVSQDSGLVRPVDRLSVRADANALRRATQWHAGTTLADGLGDLIRTARRVALATAL
jgi:UDP-glucose 4-epimerase